MEVLCEWCLLLSVGSRWGVETYDSVGPFSIFITFKKQRETGFFGLPIHVLVTAISDIYIHLLDNLVSTATSCNKEKAMINKAVTLDKYKVVVNVRVKMWQLITAPI